MEDGFYIAALCSAPGLGARTVSRLLSRFGTAERAWRTEAAELREVLAEKALPGLLAYRKKAPDRPQEIADACEKQGIGVCVPGNESYPATLREIFDPPPVLFYRGTLQPAAERIAIVGARKSSVYGRHVAEELAAALAKCGVTVVSGAARGIDSASHRGAMSGGRTVAVLGCGVDVAYPPENASLLDEIAAQGAVISEYPPGTRPQAAFFPSRNRIISGLSRGTVVVEAAERSGSLITAELALSEGRDVFAVPGSIYSPSSRGCHRLIQQGAKLVTAAADILEEYGWCSAEEKETSDKQGTDTAGPKLSPEEQAVYDTLSFDEALTVDEIIFRLHGRPDVANVAFLLLQMELAGWVEEDANHAYSRAVKEVKR
ncbi:MAG: DNA-processing protein DprA [Schwartzia sp.]|nr:DNA-processing protein DprA [Schwartzia sp. (in: firmicutes)]